MLYSLYLTINSFYIGSFYWVLDFATSYTTAMHILSFAILRCFAVYRPFKMSVITTRRTTIYICFLWVVAIVSALPMFWVTAVVANTNGEKLLYTENLYTKRQ